MNNTEIKNRVDAVVTAMEDKKAENIVVIDLSKIDGAICDAFVVCEAQSNTQVDAICNEIDRQMFEKVGEKVWRVEGKENGLWIIMDYGDILVHIFERETRTFYALEELWSDAPQTKIASQY